MNTNYLDWPKTLLLIKNPQLLFNLYETWWKYSSHEYFMLLEYQLDWIKIVNFLLIAKFWATANNFYSPSKYFSFHLVYSRYVNQIAYTLQSKYLVIICKEGSGNLRIKYWWILNVQDGINIQGGIFHKINKNTGPNKCVQDGNFSKN